MPRMQASWNGTVIADSEETVVVEGNHYFPLSSVHRTFLKESSHNSFCPWKGTASYYDIQVDGAVNKNAAWYYAEPKEAASRIRGLIAFWHGVEIRPFDSEPD